MNTERLYNLLPTIYRQRDLEQGEPLRALLGIMEEEYNGVEADITAVYNDLFIETCDEWAIPYIADLLGIEFENTQAFTINQRARVANGLRYRRRKGQTSVIEQIIKDLTGLYSHMVEFFQALTVTQSIYHLRPGQGMTAQIRNVTAMSLLNTAFDPSAHTADILNLTSRQPEYAVDRIGLFVWRLNNYPLANSPALQVKLNSQGEAVPLTSTDTPTGYYTFSPLALDLPLYNMPQPLTTAASRTQPVNLPMALQPLLVADDLDKYYGVNQAFYLQKQLATNGNTAPSLEPVLVDSIVLMDLTKWQQPPEGKVAVDLQLGRITVPVDEIPAGLQINYNYAFSTNLGGGPYQRQTNLTTAVEQGGVADITVKADPNHPSPDPLQQALDNLPQQTQVIIEIQDSRVYMDPNFLKTAPPRMLNTLLIRAQAGMQPTLVLANGNMPPPTVTLTTDTSPVKLNIRDARTNLTIVLCLSLEDALTYLQNLDNHSDYHVNQFTAVIEIQDNGIYVESPVINFTFPAALSALTIQAKDGFRPTIGQWPGTMFTFTPSSAKNSTQPLLTINGLLIEGGLIFNGSLTVAITDSTLVPRNDVISISVTDPNSLNLVTLAITIDKSIVGAVRLPIAISGFTVSNSIIDSVPDKSDNPRPSLAAPDDAQETNALLPSGPACRFERVTVFGPVFVHELTLASESIFMHNVIVDDTQIGCMRYSSLPANTSVTPPRYRCQPDFGLQQWQDITPLNEQTPAQKYLIQQSLVPQFNSMTYGQPTYAQLSPNTSKAITMGAENGAEMGVFQSLNQPQRAANISQLLQEYLPAGLIPTVIYVD